MNDQEPEAIKDGIYFHMPESQYHAIEALSASGMKKMLISLLTFYTETFDPTYVRHESIPMTKGKAYHKRILEGAEAFVNSYVAKLSREDYPEALDTQADLKDYCSKHDLAVSGTKPVLIDRILGSDPKMVKKIFALMQEKFFVDHSHQEHISKEDFDEVEKAAAILEASNLAMHFTGGFPEISIIWTDEATGVRCKARFDYLRPDIVPDLKTFSNSRRKSIETCVSQAVAYERYNIQAVHYMDGLDAIKKMFRADNYYCDRPDTTDFLNLVASQEQEFVFVFQESGQVNNCLARKFTKKTHGRPNAYWGSTEDRIFDLKHQYRDFMKSHGREKPWLIEQTTEYFDDGSFPFFMVEG